MSSFAEFRFRSRRGDFFSLSGASKRVYRKVTCHYAGSPTEEKNGYYERERSDREVSPQFTLKIWTWAAGRPADRGDANWKLITLKRSIRFAKTFHRGIDPFNLPRSQCILIHLGAHLGVRAIFVTGVKFSFLAITQKRLQLPRSNLACGWVLSSAINFSGHGYSSS